MEWFTLKLYFPIVFKVYTPTHKPYSRAELIAMPNNTVGKSLVAFLDKTHLDLIAGYELHDIKHLLIGYGTGFEDEIQLQYFELGNGNSSLPVWLVILLGTVLAPEFIPQFIAAYKRGKKCKPITPKTLIANITTDLTQLQKQLLLV
jgi:ubiquinone biosynthesis protein Coq4